MNKIIIADVDAYVVCVGTISKEHKIADLKIASGNGYTIVVHLVVGSSLE